MYRLGCRHPFHIRSVSVPHGHSSPAATSPPSSVICSAPNDTPHRLPRSSVIPHCSGSSNRPERESSSRKATPQAADWRASASGSLRIGPSCRAVSRSKSAAGSRLGRQCKQERQGKSPASSARLLFLANGIGSWSSQGSLPHFIHPSDERMVCAIMSRLASNKRVI